MDNPGPSRIWPTASHRKRNAGRRQAMAAESHEEPKVSKEVEEEVEAIDEHGQLDDTADIGAREDDAHDTESFLGVQSILPCYRVLGTTSWRLFGKERNSYIIEVNFVLICSHALIALISLIYGDVHCKCASF
ncbi:hypothetical protein MRB53_028654 [Persea americana]|uniref:Uncharacterized protein n=1 Tax=Persea americana TaxID=3435 RepID=A0ACC2KGN4_PERAE|nr:hypothetical protein MRB53_028654 [Persea americana]